jgi:hypothetical protein
MLQRILRRQSITKGFAGLLVMAILLSGSVAFWKARQHRRLVSEIRHHGSYRDSADNNRGIQSRLRRWLGKEGSSRSVRLHGPEVDDAWMLRFGYLRGLSPTELDLDDTSITAEGLAALVEGNPRLISLELRGSDVSDATIAAIRQNHSLYWVDLRGSTLTDRQIAWLPLSRLAKLGVAETLVGVSGLVQQIPECVSLNEIGLDGRQCTPETLDALVKLDRRLRIHLVGPDVTDVHLDRIAVLQPSELRLIGTSVTDEAIRLFRISHPKCVLASFDER